MVKLKISSAAEISLLIIFLFFPEIIYPQDFPTMGTIHRQDAGLDKLLGQKGRYG
jgi:hypothetical protein